VKIAVLDYDAGNLASVVHGLRHAGLDPVVTRDRQEIIAAQAVVLPGVGAFARGMDNLRRYRLTAAIEEAAGSGKPFLGICLGMQLLFEEGHEHGRHAGLGLLTGKVVRFPEGLKIPHMGWNTLEFNGRHPAFAGIEEGSHVYFVHSYYASGCDPACVSARTKYGVEFPAAVCFNNIWGMQFHPEKSSRVGLRILSNFGELVRKWK